MSKFLKCNRILLQFILVLAITSCSISKSTTSSNNSTSTKIFEEDPFLDRGNIRFVFYNVENLFDTFDDSLTHDGEFLPWGMKGWKTERYEDKLKKIFKVLVNVGGWELPEMIGLCEIENRLVLEDLIKKTPLTREKYGIIQEDSPDARGIDLGFLYRKDAFLPLNHEAINITFPFDSTTKTRDLLYIEGLVNSKKDTLHVFICHFPSRRGGKEASQPKRAYVASQVRKRVEAIMRSNPNAKIIVTGDFNDEPTDKSILEVLHAKGNWEDLKNGEFHNYMYNFKVKEGLGTYKYQGYWNMLDQWIVSQGLMDNQSKSYLKSNSGQIFKRPWLMQDDPDAPGQKPFRTYGGSFYYGGYSDHLPIYLDIFFNK